MPHTASPSPAAGDSLAYALPLDIATLQSAHARSRGFGLSENARPDYALLTPNALAQEVDRHRLFYQHALPLVETLYQQIANTHSMIVLTDASGLVLHSLGDDDFLAKAEKVALQPGAVWTEQNQGTNAIGTALAELRPATVHGDQHFLKANQFLTCASVPILDPQGGLSGVIDVTGDCRGYHRHTMSLVRMSAQTLENQLLRDAFTDVLYLGFHGRREFVGTLMEGIAVFSLDGRLLAMNASARFQLGLDDEVAAQQFDRLFDPGLEQVLARCHAAGEGWMPLCLHNGVLVQARAQLRMRALPSVGRPAPRLSRLGYLNTGDAQLARVLERVGKVLGRDVPVLITGETGTGKEMLAQAMHADSPRADKPFVAVNCASIPETLIESELFGYADGAFTGARQKGHRGKIVQAHGGTLFLDEIGDMPLALQARLLRVLQQREVMPLGSAQAIPVDIALICATHCDLPAMVQAGEFRADLYYRIQGLTVRLPPTRERTDLAAVIRKMLNTESTAQVRYTLSAQVMDLFLGYSWPGNFRQLYNVLHTACVLAGDEAELTLEHLPDDFVAVAEEGESADCAMANGRLATVTQAAINAALAEHEGNVSAAARALGVSRNTIYRKQRH
ncbi:sigma-54-dependent Fis family transcriptional regulator [Silvimonas amylolytica]|uniref:Sigma-54-dependent Fis family transcriptional regulator n=1 Tax=Silvimonas amylolytica TaxID=449663 RepID=A0ABQ2PR95_9NEIS|nr:sigma-54-dependent Fis family transcriptional regulator [Silvimonas amylolytica]GGP27502.1 sigma-54-dependent Fis family transcriptional regulator [Silvimonas amylolytica]